MCKQGSTFDALNRPVTVIDYNGANPIVTIVEAYDPGGRKTLRSEDGKPVTYTYDNANRLIGQLGVGRSATFVYDEIGNTTVKWHQGQAPLTMVYDPASRLVSNTQGAVKTTYTFDKNGNMSTDTSGGVMTAYVYDKLNHLKKVTYSDGTLSTYTYNGDGLRYTRQEPGQKVYTMVWDGTNYLGEI